MKLIKLKALNKFFITLFIVVGLIIPQDLFAVELVSYDNHTPTSVYILVAMTLTVVITYWYGHRDSKRITLEETYANVHPEEYLFSPSQMSEYKALAEGTPRLAYIQSFWETMDPTPKTMRNENLENFMEGVEYTNRTFNDPTLPGWLTDRGRFYLLYGKPDYIKQHPFERAAETTELEIWYYNRPAGGNHLPMIFLDFNAGGMFTIFEDHSLYGHYEQVFSTELDSQPG